ncbi:MAG: phenylacetate--CoA ligase family protein [Cytophagaceae bacterium]
MIPEIERLSIEGIKKCQEKALQGLLQYVNECSPFYKAYFKKHKIDPAQIKKLTDLSMIPPIGKKELQENASDFYCVSRDKIIDYCNTSGTEGEPITIPLTEKDLERLTYNEYLSLHCAGGSREEIYQLTTTSDRRFMAGLAYVMGARKIGAGMVRVGPGLPGLHWKTIEEVKPTALIVVPSFLLKLLEYAEDHKIDYKKSSIKKAICIGEPVRNEDFSLNLIGQKIKEKWDIELYSTYASTEMATAFTECNHGKGGHEHPELIITELLDDHGQAVAPGEAGELTITTLGVEGMPLIRFKTGDVCIKYTETCSCGRNTSRLGPILGRKNQMIKYKGTTLYPSVLFDIMENIVGVHQYVVEVYSNEYANDEIIIRFCAGRDINMKKLGDQFKSKARVTPQLIAVSQSELHGLMFSETSRKPVKFIDKRTKVLNDQ